MNSRAVPVVLLALALAAFLLAGFLLLPACALAHFGGVWNAGCPSERDVSRDAERLALLAQSEEIQRRIDLLEARLTAQTCEGEHPDILIDPDRPPGAADRDRTDLDRLPDRFGGTDPDTPFPDRSAEIDPDAPLPPDADDLPAEDADPMDDVPGDEGAETPPDAPRDLADLEGCWGLESELEFRMNGGDGGTQPVPEWNVCFEEGSEGNGTQVMRSDDGMSCEGPITGAFNAEGALVLTEEDDLVCNDGTEIFQRVTTCAVDESGVAACESVQPSTGGRGDFTLRRN